MLAFQNAVASAAMIFENIGRRARRRTGQAEQLLKTRDTKSLGPKSYLLTPSPSPGSMLRRRDLQIPWSEGLLTPSPSGRSLRRRNLEIPWSVPGYLLTPPLPHTTGNRQLVTASHAQPASRATTRSRGRYSFRRLTMRSAACSPVQRAPSLER